MGERHRSLLRERLIAVGISLLALILLCYPADWAIWRLRAMAGGGMDEVTVTQTTAATLKGNHFEVYSPNTGPVPCSRSLLPQAGAGACWWLRRHPQIITQY